jgi:hypothetical protein
MARGEGRRSRTGAADRARGRPWEAQGREGGRRPGDLALSDSRACFLRPVSTSDAGGDVCWPASLGPQPAIRATAPSAFNGRSACLWASRRASLHLVAGRMDVPWVRPLTGVRGPALAVMTGGLPPRSSGETMTTIGQCHLSPGWGKWRVAEARCKMGGGVEHFGSGERGEEEINTRAEGVPVRVRLLPSVLQL